jgi:hypothetical protein
MEIDEGGICHGGILSIVCCYMAFKPKRNNGALRGFDGIPAISKSIYANNGSVGGGDHF